MRSEAEKIKIRVGERPDGTEVSLPLVRWTSGEGPRVFFGISIHGDEVTGQASFWRLADFLSKNRVRGAILIMPSMNPEGFNYNVRGIPETTEDLNRMYPGDPKGWLGQRITAKIFETAMQCDYAIDVHTAGWSIPFVLIDPVSGELRKRTEELAWATGLTVLEEYTQEKYELENLGASLSGAILKRGKVSFTIELGGTKGIDWGSVEAGFLSMKNILAYLGIIQEPLEEVKSIPIIRERGYRREEVFCESGGLVEYVCALADKVKRGQVLARIRSRFGDVVEVVKSPKEGFVVCLDPYSRSGTGYSIATLAVRG